MKSTTHDFKQWMLERHRIYTRRQAGQPVPWTDDTIMREWKFTNVFRELDRGTVALHGMLEKRYGQWWRQLECPSLENIVFNVCWYRLFNLDGHAHGLGVADSADEVRAYIEHCHQQNLQIFTAAHMLTGSGGGPKHVLYCKTVDLFFESKEEIVKGARETQTLEALCAHLRLFPMVGPFLAYEMACDLRWVEGLWPALGRPMDAFSWANPGPGAKRGLARLGRPETVQGMVDLYYEVTNDPNMAFVTASPCAAFELREIEHSLCEFDKYERVRLGEGQPRQRYRPQ